MDASRHQTVPISGGSPEPQRGMIYLASPYSHDDPEVRERRFRQVCAAAARLMRGGHHIFSPIAHSHPIALAGNLPGDFEYWRAYDEAMIAACAEVWVLRLDGWQDSKGIEAEIMIAASTGKPVRFINLCGCGAVHVDGEVFTAVTR